MFDKPATMVAIISTMTSIVLCVSLIRTVNLAGIKWILAALVIGMVRWVLRHAEIYDVLPPLGVERIMAAASAVCLSCGLFRMTRVFKSLEQQEKEKDEPS